MQSVRLVYCCFQFLVYIFPWGIAQACPQIHAVIDTRKIYGSISSIILLPQPQEKPADTDGAALIHRYEEEIPEFCMLFFSYEGKCYQIKVENGVPIVEECKSENDLKKDYMWKGLL